ncbi:Laccase-4 [Vitis vinifera]|uniref:laccase n=1 Tax=Vitis vinifera TaxID=29760 RepID=A0A438BY45_VITVI|nr:Laccase-4 [Vitis vinifera]
MKYSWVRVLVLVACLLPALVECRVRQYTFNVVLKNTNRLCASKPIVTVNGRFPGPTLYVREDDTVLVRVVNHVKYNVSIHWHGIRQLRTGWSDGPAYITQCPIQTGQSYLYNFTVTGQRGTLLWHAHVLWLRATVHGAIVILPKRGVPYPFPKPHKEVVVILGEWWKSDVEAVINQALSSGLAPNVSDAHTINGHPGPVSNCPSQGGFSLQVEAGKTYLLRIINAALNEELFFKIAGHQLSVVEVDAVYTSHSRSTLLLLPLAKPQMLLSQQIKALAILLAHLHQMQLQFANKFVNSLRSLNSKKYPAKVPLTVDHSLFITVGLGINPCATCVAGNGSRAVASMNNVTFVMPTTAILQAHYFNISDTGIIATENHPVHLHGFNFFAVGKGLGNYNPKTDPQNFNLIDPVERNTIGVPSGGWTAIRFLADNPGVWFMHCHLEVHTTWGLKMAFLVDNGKGPNQSIIPPPSDLPKC